MERVLDADWFKEALKETANYTDANVNVQGGINDAARYNLFLDYMDQTGLFNVPNSSRYKQQFRFTQVQYPL
ncbi:MAG: hypothetical protein QM727_15120 [Niabella sp.]